MEDLPPEVMQEIISRLPVKPLCRFKCVSQQCRSMVSDPDFAANYPRRRRVLFALCSYSSLCPLHCILFERNTLYSLDPDQFLNDENGNCDVEEVDFVNGVPSCSPFVLHSSYALFLSHHVNSTGSYFSLNNPVTKESKKLPIPPTWRRPMNYYSLYLYGVGFDHSTNEYKVINVQDYDDGMVFSVYTLQTNSWRQIDGLFPYLPEPSYARLVNGGFHWLVEKIADESLVILSFLYAQEEVREIPLPPSTLTTTCDIRSGRLGAFRNWLCITSVVLLSSGQERRNEFLVMKEYGVAESWSVMRVSIPYRELLHSGFWTETHDVLLFDQTSFVMYNFNDGTFWYLSIPVTAECDFLGSVGTYLETLPLQTGKT